VCGREREREREGEGEREREMYCRVGVCLVNEKMVLSAELIPSEIIIIKLGLLSHLLFGRFECLK
jgi:hypothetical protein